MTDTINKTLLTSVLTSIHISIHKQFFVIPSPLRPQVKFFSKLVWDVSLVVYLCTHQLSFGPLTNVAIHPEVGISPLLNTVTILLSHLLLDHWSDFFKIFLGCFPGCLVMYAQIWYWSIYKYGCHWPSLIFLLIISPP